MTKLKTKRLIDKIIKHCGRQNRVLIKAFIYDCNKILKKYIENHIRVKREVRLIRELEMRDYYYRNYHHHDEFNDFDVEEELNYL